MVASGLPATLLNRLRAVPTPWWQRLVLALALFWLLYTLARTTWRVHDALTWTVPPPPASAVAIETPVAVDIEALVATNLFGSVDIAAPEPTSEDAPDSSASLKLLGVYAADNELKASAIIEETSGAQSVVFVNEPLPGGYGTLKQVFYDRIVMDRGGRLETLRMEDLTGQLGDLSGGQPADLPGKAEARTLDKRRDAQLTQSLQDMRTRLQTNPASLTDVLSIEPSYEKGSGQLLGYRLGPGKDRKLFGRFGLQRNDLVTAINGVTLDDPTRALALFNDLNDAKELSITLQRGGQPVTIQLSLQNP
ncbi:type II secretion system protein GspC [Permianibacter sp. IMCC34836]|uniref:type II secretion system protein GspC n=1 Tax=Permianibacter fluminis TaxID=2738515 RepID=UPI0015546363|nr:type II secretion system protein GspC [Permianibacter fluminis]NQD35660.1 type II secretion system protein GspC [Permianibacter fluminis]